MIMGFDDFAIHGKLMKQGIRFRFKIKEIFLYENNQKSVSKIGRKDEFNYF